jgi:hypothetical protein
MEHPLPARPEYVTLPHSTHSPQTIAHHAADGEIPSKPYSAIYVDFPELPATNDDREAALLQADSYLNELLDTLTSYTVLYTTTPASNHMVDTQHPDQYEMDDSYPSSMHIDLKRDLNAHINRKANSTNPQAHLPLFEKYQFLSPGMSILILPFPLHHTTNSIVQQSSWALSSASSSSPFSTLVSVPFPALKSLTWPLARKWALQLRKSRCSSRSLIH